MRPKLHVRIPQRTNLLAAALCVAAHLYQYFVLPLALLPADRSWLLTLIPVCLLTTTNWAVLHEAFHDNLHPKRHVNDAAGRIMGVLFGAPFRTLRFGHLLHHQLNGTLPDRPEAYDPAVSSRLRAALIYYPRLFFGLYGIELSGTLLALLPRWMLEPVVRRIFKGANPEAIAVPDRAVKHLLDDRHLSEIRIDSIMALAVLGLSGVSFGADWPVLVLVLIARGIMVSFHDNAYHYGAPLECERASYNLRASKLSAALMLNFNLHRVHHRYPALPWSGLPRAFAEDREIYDGALLPAALQQLAGPVPASQLAGSD